MYIFKCQVNKNLSESAPRIANYFIERFDEVIKNEDVVNKSTAEAFQYFLKLAIRSFSGLLLRNYESADDYSMIEEMIDTSGSKAVVAHNWCTLAIRYHLNKRYDDCKKIISNKVLPLINSISENEKYDRNEVISINAPALYIFHKTIAFELIGTISENEQDEAFYRIIRFILKKHPLADPYDEMKSHIYKLSYDELHDICELIDKMQNDGLICSIIHSVVCSITSKEGKLLLSIDQKVNIKRKLEDIIEKKLPNNRFITHDGYKIAASSTLGRIFSESSEFWETLIDKCKKIDNVSDKAVTLTIISDEMPSKYDAKKKELIRTAKKEISKIPFILEKTKRLNFLIDVAIEIDPPFARKCLLEAIDLVTVSDEEDYIEQQKKIIDLAYRIDPDIANEIASISDTDPARVMARTNMKSRLELHNLKKDLFDEVKKESNYEKYKDQLPEAAWMRLGALNSGRIHPIKLTDSFDLMKAASEYPINQAYPIFSLIIENALKKYTNTNQAAEYFKPIFRATVIAAKLALKVNYVKPADSDFKLSIGKNVNSINTIIKAGQRDKAMEILCRWYEDNADSYIKICDPWFGPEELDIVKLFQGINNNIEFYILTSTKHHKQNKMSENFEGFYRNHWRLKLSDQDPPLTEIIIIGTMNSGDMPIHDRWILSKKSGVRIGCSLNGLGINKESEISFIGVNESIDIEVEIDRYLNRQIKNHNGEKLLYSQFNL